MIFTETTVEFDTIDDLIIFTRYNPKNDKSVPSGYLLSEDMVNNEGGVLYTKESEVDALKIGRLKKILENNPDMKPKISLKRNDLLFQIEREKILSALHRLIDSKRSRPEFNKLMKMIQNTLDSQWNSILPNPDTVLYISQLKFLEDKTKKSKINPYYNHMLNTVIFSIGIMINIFQVNQEKFTTDEMVEMVSAAFFHAARGWETSGQFIESPIEERRKKYIEANSGNFNYLKKYDLNKNSLDAIEFCYQFQSEKLDFLQNDSKPAKYAQIISVASTFNERISGLWDDARSPREIIDALYVKCNEKKMPKIMVDALAKALKFSNLFDFYHELEELVAACHRQASKPYPLTGFKSPIIFVCEKNMMECKEYVASAKSITVFKETGGLPEGSYGRCEGLSAKLISFYEEHYHDIKEEVIEKTATKSGDDKNSSEEE